MENELVDLVMEETRERMAHACPVGPTPRRCVETRQTLRLLSVGLHVEKVVQGIDAQHPRAGGRAPQPHDARFGETLCGEEGAQGGLRHREQGVGRVREREQATDGPFQAPTSGVGPEP